MVYLLAEILIGCLFITAVGYFLREVYYECYEILTAEEED